jgi:hypothetical protein
MHFSKTTMRKVDVVSKGDNIAFLPANEKQRRAYEKGSQNW